MDEISAELKFDSWDGLWKDKKVEDEEGKLTITK